MPDTTALNDTDSTTDGINQPPQNPKPKRHNPLNPRRTAAIVAATFGGILLTLLAALVITGFLIYRETRKETERKRPSTLATRALLNLVRNGGNGYDQYGVGVRFGYVGKTVSPVLDMSPPVRETWIITFSGQDDVPKPSPPPPLLLSTPVYTTTRYVKTPGLGKFGRPHPLPPPGSPPATVKIPDKANWELINHRAELPFRDSTGKVVGWELSGLTLTGTGGVRIGTKFSGGSGSSSSSSGTSSVVKHTSQSHTFLPNHFIDLTDTGDAEITGGAEVEINVLPLRGSDRLTGTINTSRSVALGETQSVTGINGSHVEIHGGGVEIFKIPGALTVPNLVALGADPNAREKANASSLYPTPATWGVMEWMNPLVWKAWWDNRDKNKYLANTALMNAIDFAAPFSERPEIRPGSMRMVKELLDAGADPNLPATVGRTPLSEAIMWESLETVKLLMQHGANPRLPNDIYRKTTPITDADARVKTEKSTYETAIKISPADVKVMRSTGGSVYYGLPLGMRRGTTTSGSVYHGLPLGMRRGSATSLMIQTGRSTSSYGATAMGKVIKIYGYDVPTTGTISPAIIAGIKARVVKDTRDAAKQRLNRVLAMRAALDQPVVPYVPPAAHRP